MTAEGRYQLTTGFVVGAVLIPAGTTVDLNKPPQFFNEWEKLANGRDIPADAILLDSGAVRAWRKAYHEVGRAPWLSPKIYIEDWWDTDEFRPLVREAAEKILTEPIKQEK
jgi:hypothetical protein